MERAYACGSLFDVHDVANIACEGAAGLEDIGGQGCSLLTVGAKAPLLMQVLGASQHYEFVHLGLESPPNKTIKLAVLVRNGPTVRLAEGAIQGTITGIFQPELRALQLQALPPPGSEFYSHHQ
eukprot:599372-Amphidinium_carterae.1